MRKCEQLASYLASFLASLTKITRAHARITCFCVCFIRQTNVDLLSMTPNDKILVIWINGWLCINNGWHIFILEFRNVEKFLRTHKFCQSVLVIWQTIKNIFTIIFWGIPYIMTETLGKEMSCRNSFNPSPTYIPFSNKYLRARVHISIY